MNILNILLLIFVLLTTLFMLTGERYYIEGFKLRKSKFPFKLNLAKIFKKARKTHKLAIQKTVKSLKLKPLKIIKKFKKKNKTNSKAKRESFKTNKAFGKTFRKMNRKTKSKKKSIFKSKGEHDLSGDFSAAKLNSQFDLKSQDQAKVGKSVKDTQKTLDKKQKSGVNKIDAHSDKRTNEIDKNAGGKYRESMGGDPGLPGCGAAKVAKKVWKTTTKFASKSWKSTSKFAGKAWKDTSKFASKKWKDGSKAVVGVANSAGKAISKTGKDAGKAIGKFFCFSGDTPIKRLSGGTVLLKNLKLGDVLINGETVDATMQIKSSMEDPFYRIYSEDISGYIYVTGSHYIQIEEDVFINVRDFDYAEKLDTVDDILYCLVTSDHTIPVGEYTFSDWETDQFEEID